MSLLVRACDTQTSRTLASSETHPITRLRLELHSLAPGQALTVATEGRELGALVLGGSVDVACGSEHVAALGGRANVFAGSASAVYAPPGSEVRFTGAGELAAEVMLCTAPAESGGAFTVIRPGEYPVREVGKANWRRRVEDVFAPAPASSLLLGETFNPPGNWSSYPPHKHDTEVPGREVELEEVYHYRLDPPQGFAIQCIYTADRELDEALTVRNGDTVVIPRGYHPVVAAPGYRLYYLWALAGPRRIMRPCDDPEHAWVKAMEPLLPA